VPTLIESGFPDFDITGALGVFAPSATPKEAIERLSTEIVRAVQLPEVKTGLLRDGFVVDPSGTSQYDAFTRVKIQQILKIAKAAKIKLD
jgi:tripartite-type tricarboxylate transporter receptor subunit TctC